MRCLNCHKDGILKNDTICPACHTYLPILLRDVLPQGMMLHSNTYRINYALDRGGFGIVYRAVHTGLDCLVAIKEFYPREYATRGNDGRLQIPFANRKAFDAEYQQFLLEGRILAGLSHPGITKVMDLFEERGTVYLVMELLGGQSLRQELEQQPGGKLEPERVHKVIEQLVITLEFLHRHKIYHLDIKPENVFVRSNGHFVLIDFGAARFGVDGYVRRQFDPDYAAPELLKGEDVGPQSDLYELGVMAYELLTGIRPSSALARVYNNKWDVAGLSEPWHSCLTSALQLAKGKRPESVLSWWLQTMGDSLPPLFRKHSDIFLDPEDARDQLKAKLLEEQSAHKGGKDSLSNTTEEVKKPRSNLQKKQNKSRDTMDASCDTTAEIVNALEEARKLRRKLEDRTSRERW